MLNWTKQFNIFCLLDNQQYHFLPHHYECLLAAGVTHAIETDNLDELDAFFQSHKDWCFGHLSYALASAIHSLTIKTEREISFPGSYFFVPEYLLVIEKNELIIYAENPDAIYKDVMNSKADPSPSTYQFDIKPTITKEEYLEKIKSLQQHILRGDCYEINFCVEFFAEDAVIEPAEVYRQLMKISPNPFSAFYRLQHRYMMCASPERFLCLKDGKIISQPIKGTIRRNSSNPYEDAELKDQLLHSQKDRSENVMVVDMVRNDLSKVCKPASVQADELFGIYSFPQVHHMISTVSGILKNDVSFSTLVNATFPMGSMTGAPKYKVMQLIDEYELSGRGIFSGSVGYVSPTGDFDFNVIIRSILYNASSGYLSYRVGSGITFYSDPEQEWEECLLKAEAIKKVLGN